MTCNRWHCSSIQVYPFSIPMSSFSPFRHPTTKLHLNCNHVFIIECSCGVICHCWNRASGGVPFNDAQICSEATTLHLWFHAGSHTVGNHGQQWKCGQETVNYQNGYFLALLYLFLHVYSECVNCFSLSAVMSYCIGGKFKARGTNVAANYFIWPLRTWFP